MIKQIPNIDFITRPEKDFIKVSSDEIFKNKNIVLFALPGAFTPTCNDYHLPGYELNYEELKKLGVDEVYCLSVNDAFVLKAWSKNLNLKHVKMLPDGNLNFTKAMNMIVDRSAAGMGMRSKRYSMYIKNRNIEKIFVEEDGKFDVSDSNTMLNYIKSSKLNEKG
jgi:peroxiredoxin